MPSSFCTSTKHPRAPCLGPARRLHVALTRIGLRGRSYLETPSVSALHLPHASQLPRFPPMSDSDAEPVPAIAPDAEIEHALRSAVRDLWLSGDHQNLTLRRVRKSVEDRLSLPDCFLKNDPAWKGRSENIITDQVVRELSSSFRATHALTRPRRACRNAKSLRSLRRHVRKPPSPPPPPLRNASLRPRRPIPLASPRRGSVKRRPIRPTRRKLFTATRQSPRSPRPRGSPRSLASLKMIRTTKVTPLRRRARLPAMKEARSPRQPTLATASR